MVLRSLARLLRFKPFRLVIVAASVLILGGLGLFSATLEKFAIMNSRTTSPQNSYDARVFNSNGIHLQPTGMETLSSSSTLLLKTPEKDFPAEAIYFLETSGLPFLSPKQVCAVESAAHHNRERPVVVAVASQHIILTAQLREVLNQHGNIRIVQLDLPFWVNGTKLKPWLAKGLLDKSQHRVLHTRYVLRYVTLFKYGGIYLDLDVIVLQSLGGLKNAVGIEQYTPTVLINNAVMGFDKGHPVMDACMDDILWSFNGNSGGANGPVLISTVLKEWCGLPDHESLTGPQTCKGVRLLDQHIFYPVHHSIWKSLFEDNLETSRDIHARANRSLLIHYWNGISSASNVDTKSNQALAGFARKNCPIASADASGLLWGYLSI